MGIAEKMMAARFNRPGFEIINNMIFGIMGDGDLMEGVSHEAASLAGHLRLGNIVFVYDDNEITIEGKTSLTFSEDIEMRFRSYGWHVQKVNGHDRKDIEAAVAAACAETSKPSIIVAKTTIGCCAPTKAGTHSCHGEPLGSAEVAAMKESLGWPKDPSFYIPENVSQLFAEVKAGNEKVRKDWEELFARYREAHPDLAEQWDAMWSCSVPEDITEKLMASIDLTKEMATRESGGMVLQEIAKLVPSLVGGSADLAPSTKTWIKDASAIQRGDFAGKNFHFGIREHAMGSIMNGMACYGGFIPFGSTFLVFSDYMRPTMRIAAINHNQVVYVFTHDSIFVGEDGPTHQPIEHIPSMRTIPNVTVISPADTAETVAAWSAAMKNTTGPTVLALTRQKLPPVSAENPMIAKGLEKGAYVASEAPNGKIDAILIASGSEVSIALGAQKILSEQGISCRVVSMPSFELFEKQPCDYKESVLPSSIEARVSVEASCTFGWERYVGSKGLVIGMTRFGASAPANTVAENFGFTSDAVAARVKKYIGS
jgi:transketolase